MPFDDMTYVPTVPLARASACCVTLHYPLHCPTLPCYSQFGVPSPLHRSNTDLPNDLRRHWCRYRNCAKIAASVLRFYLWCVNCACLVFKGHSPVEQTLQLPWSYSDDRICIKNVTSKISKYTISMLHLLQVSRSSDKTIPRFSIAGSGEGGKGRGW